MTRPGLVLASASPRRQELLHSAGWSFLTHPADVDETRLPDEPAAAYVLRLAEAKARAVAPRLAPTHAALDSTVILGADTVVALEGAVLGKPSDPADAHAMLRLLSGKRHQVLTGISLLRGSLERSRVETTQVWFSPLSQSDIAAYVATGEPMGKAGAYAIQGRAACFIPRIEGSYSNVVGLPLAALWELWRQVAG